MSSPPGPVSPADLIRFEPDLPDLPGGLVMIEALDGFVDAGAARRLGRDHLLGTSESRPVAVFDADLLHDYRARRPVMLFDHDHWASYDGPRLEIRLLTDAAARPYLLLSGPEPDVMWERFAAAVTLAVERLGIRLVVGTNAIPMAVPHTRPVGVTAHGSRRELIADWPQWVGTVQVPGSAGHLIEHRLSERGIDAMGFAVHVPHYVAQAAYPPAAHALLAAVARASGLALPLEALAGAAEDSLRALGPLVEQSEELTALVRTLETQYDAVVAEQSGPPLSAGGPLPTADELGAELERFLAEQSRRGDEPHS